MILVTGATGLVGGHLIWHLLQENEKVIAIKRNTSNTKALKTIFSFYTENPEVYLQKIEWRIADVLDKDSLVTVFDDIHIVYHCAAVVSLSNSGSGLTETNVIGTRNIVNVSLYKKISKFCFVSSIAACGHTADNQLVNENTKWKDNEHRSAYAQSKYLSEQEVWRGMNEGLKAVIVNPGVILGVSGTESGSSQLFSQVKKGLIFYTNGGSGYVDVQDVVKSMILLTKSEISNERFIIVAQNCSNKEILSWMADGFGKTRPRILIGKKLLFSIGFLSEMAAKIFNFTTLIDRSMARSATNREFYSNSKSLGIPNFKYKSVEKCITEVCEFLKK
jgi:nucleoside-diphosphate-sugar epimerase